MNIAITAQVDDDADIDAGHDMGITNAAYERLVDALSSAGLSVLTIEREEGSYPKPNRRATKDRRT